MAKLTLTDILGQYASTTELNNNFALIEAALENTLSRDGTSPNTMSADLDLNSNRITNLPKPVNGTEPVRLIDQQSNDASLPDQTGEANKVFKTDGVSATWQTQDAQHVTNTPAGEVVATTVQAAIDELDTEKTNQEEVDATAIAFAIALG